MATHAEDRTEAPTPRRRQEARSKGQVARSQDLTAAVVLVAAFATLRLFGPHLWRTLLAVVSISLSPDSPMRLDEMPMFAGAVGTELAKRLAPLFVVLFLAAVVVLYAQVGLLFTWQPLMPSLAKINPLNGFARLFSLRSVMAAVTSFAKLILVGVVAYFTIAHGAASILHSFTFGFHDVVRLGCALTFELGMKLSVALLILALLDFAWQRFRHERDLRMTKEEVKDELRSMEGDPSIKRRRRQLQLQMAMQRLRKDVPKADVVVTNPTHLAVAIAYDAETMIAPKVVAKGADEIALRIRQIAAEFGIPIVERKPLARALYDTVDVGQYIPEQFYRAIAEILAYIYELTGRSPAAARRELVGVA
jgi:flagellar biosynthetic protein FlhB